MRAFIISQPKSGTYLCSSLLAELGLRPTWKFVQWHQYTLVDPNDLGPVRRDPRPFAVKQPMEQTLAEINDNEFSAGHIPYSEKAVRALAGFKKIVICRNVEDAKASHNLWQKESGRGNPLGQDFYTLRRNVRRWRQGDVFNLRFKDLIGIDTNKIDQLQIFLFGEIRKDSRSSMQAALDAPSLTKSSKRG